jgi:predicted O-linked N-acetylglucosamine transferase (SPINDLY family)
MSANPGASESLLKTALAYHQHGQLAQAEALYRKILQVSPGHPEALHLLGVAACQQGKHAAALPLLDQAIEGKPEYAEAWKNRGSLLHEMRQEQRAVENFNQAIRLKPGYAAAWNGRGSALHKLERYQEAVESFVWAIRLHPTYADAYGNRGNSLLALHQYQRALESFDHLLRLKVDCAQAHYGRAAAFHGLGKYPEAIASWDRAILLQPDYVQAYANRGIAQFETAQYLDALASFDHALRLQPDYAYLQGMRQHLKRMVCRWDDAESNFLETEIDRGKKAVPPFMTLAITASPALQKKAAEIFVGDKYPLSAAPLVRRSRRQKIRLGYFSADFHNHAVCYLMAEAFELHDKTKFELLAFSFGPDKQDKMRRRAAGALDQFLDVRFLPDAEVVRLSRELEIDIAVDLMGFTQHARTGIFARRAAPIQVNYLGYPATMGASYIDYLIGDRTLIPETSRQHYSEQIVYLPDCFQANDSKVLPSTKCFTRAGERLPENGFVYCCFSNNYKINPTIFDVWMSILARVDGSVLWLLEGNPWVADNLRQEAERRGVSPRRLVFARGLPFSEHLARQPLADLFLDTFPFNAGAMASPALWAGLPILTCMGEAFAGRMAASLLRAIGLPELVTTTSADYEALAVELAHDKDRYREIRQRLERNRFTAPLFDTARFTRNLENAYQAMYERYQTGLPPHDVDA